MPLAKDASNSKRKSSNDELNPKNSKKKGGKKVENDESSDDENTVDQEMDAEEDDFLNEDIQVDFEAYGPNECDFEGIKKLIKQITLKEHVNLSEITELLIAQTELTVVIKQSLDEDADEEDDDWEEVYGVTSLVDLSLDKPAVKQLAEQICTHAKEANNEPAAQLLHEKANRVALVISERYVNLSSQLSIPSFDSLISEIKKDKTRTFSHFAMICKILKPKETKEYRKAAAKGSPLPEVIYVNAEEEILDQAADNSFEYSVAGQCDGDARNGGWDDDDQQFVPFRKVLFFGREKFFTSIAKLKDEI